MSTETDSYVCEDHGPYPREVEGRRQDVCPSCGAATKTAITEWRESRARFRRWTQSGIPTRYRNRSLANFRPMTPSAIEAKRMAGEFVDRFQDHYDEGRGLALIGPVGTGKTHLAVAALTGVIAAGWSGRFVSVPALFAELKAGFGSKDRDGDELLEKLRTTQFLVLDDLGASRGSEWEQDVLHGLLDHRYNEELPTAITANVFDLARYAGERIADRCRESMTFIELPGASYRGNAADDESLKSAPLAMEEPPRELNVRMCRFGTLYVETWEDDR